MSTRFRRLISAATALLAAAPIVAPVSANGGDAGAVAVVATCALPQFPTGGGSRPASCNGPGDSDVCYLDPVSLSGSVTYAVPVTATGNPDSFTMNVNASCGAGTGDELGGYTFSLAGSTSAASCAAEAPGAGTVTGSSPEGLITGTFTYARPAVHYYIQGSYVAAGETHTFTLWLDVFPTPIGCPFSTGGLRGHGAVLDPANIGVGVVNGSPCVGCLRFDNVSYSEPCPPVTGNATGRITGNGTFEYFNWTRVGLVAVIFVGDNPNPGAVNADGAGAGILIPLGVPSTACPGPPTTVAFVAVAAWT